MSKVTEILVPQYIQVPILIPGFETAKNIKPDEIAIKKTC